MKIVVTGASGLLGRAVFAQLKQDGHTVLGTALSRANPENGLVKLDLTNFDDFQEFLNKEEPQAIIHTAAERRPDVVERSPEASQILNVDVPSKIANWCKENAKSPLLINISTDYVFDGTSPPYKVDDSPNPLNAYGKSKWEGEKGVIQHGQAGRISNVRVPVLYGKTHTNDESAVNVLLNALTVGKGSDGKPKKMDANAVRYPTSVIDIAKALSQLCTKYAEPKNEGDHSTIPPTLHFSAMEAMTKYDMCLVMARCLRAVGEEAETEHLIPEYEVDPNAATSRPRHCKLDLSLTKEIGINTECTSFESWWREYLEEYAKRAREERAKEAAEAEARRVAEEERRRKEEEERKKKEEEERIKQEEERRKKEEVERLKREEEEKRKKEEEEEKEKNRVEEERIRKEGEERERKEKEAEEYDSKKTREVEDADGQNIEKESQRISSQAARQEGSNDSQVDGERVPSADKERRESAKSNQEIPTTAPEVVRSSSSTGHASLRSPSSPNPSFSSLQARPTPPATSGRSSPSPSLRSIGAASFLTGTTNMPSRNGENSAAVSSVTDANPLGMNETVKIRESEQEKGTTKNNREMEDGSGFFPQKLVQAGDGASLGIDDPRSDAIQQQGQSIDSDNYGEPSPREEGKSSLPFSAQAPFVKTGYGEVPFGVDESKAAAEQPERETATTNHQRQPSSSQDKTPRVASFQIRVGDPQKVGDPVTAHIVYTMRVITDSPHFRSAQFSVLRRYSDFRWLHAALVHNNPGIFVPPVPEKVKIGRFAPDLVEARRHGLEGCVNKIANNPVLQHDEDFKIFMESQNFHADVKARDQIKGPIPTPEQKTYFGWSTSFTGSSYKYHENDEWFDEQKVYLDHLEFQLKNLVRIVSIMAQQRKDLAAATSESSHALMMLSGSSLSRSLSTCFAGLGEVERRSFELTDAQADADVREFGSVLYEFERMVGSARKAFATRIDAWQQWQRLEDEAKKVRIKHEKVKKDVQPGSYKMHDGGRLQAVLDELANVESRCLNAKREFDVIGRRCKEEMDRFESDRIRSFHDAAEIWLQGMIERSVELMSEWEQYAALLERQTNHKIEIE